MIKIGVLVFICFDFLYFFKLVFGELEFVCIRVIGIVN